MRFAAASTIIATNAVQVEIRDKERKKETNNEEKKGVDGHAASMIECKDGQECKDVKETLLEAKPN